MWPGKRLILLWAALTMLLHLTTSFHAKAHAASEDTYFVATAYYSPLPGQSRYTTGTYAGDIRLNGSWKITASGKEVFPGLLAWPKNYPFGTKIYFEGFWIWEIADRWGAIVKAWERGHGYDRIDIWMWYGDEWLARALKWGTKTIKGKIVIPSAKVSLKLHESPIWALTKLEVNPENSIAKDVKALQQIFTKAELYNWDIDWKYSSIKNELIEFQKDEKVISSVHDEAAGWYWPKTIAALRARFGTNAGTLVEEPVEYFYEFNHHWASEKYKLILEYGDLVVKPDSEKDKVRLLQELLRELWEYNGPIDGKYQSVEKSLIDLQKEIWLIKDIDDWGAWYFWNKTKSALWIYYENHDDSNKLSDSEKARMKKALIAVKEKLLRDEKKWWKTVEKRLNNLKKQINDILPKIENSEMRQKLEYLYQII